MITRILKDADPETGKISREDISDGGDIVISAATVSLAMAAGRNSSQTIHEYQMNKG